MNGRNPSKNEAIKREQRAAPPTTGALNMSLEAALQANTAAVERLSALLAGGTAALPAQTKVGKATIDPKVADELAAVKAANKPAAAPEAVDYEKHIKPAALKLAAIPVAQGGGRDALIALYKSFGKSNAKDFKIDEYAALFTALSAKISELTTASA